MLSRITSLIGLGILVGGYSQAQQIPTIDAQPGDTAVVLNGGVSQTLNQPVPFGSVILFDAGAQGGSLNYQWTLNGDPINGATNSTLTLSNVSVVTGGSYAVTVYNDWGCVQSERAVVRMACPDIVLTDSFTNAMVYTNMAATARDDYWLVTREEGEPEHAGVIGIESKWLTWVAPCTGVAVFQTYGSSFDTVLAVYTGESVSNLTEVASDGDLWGHQGCYVMFNAQVGTQYRIAVGGYMKSGLENLVLSWQLTPTVHPLPTILQQPESQTLSEGQSTSLSIVTSDTNVIIQWYFDGHALSNANQTTLVLTNLTEADLGVYSVALISPEWTYFLKPVEIQFNTEGAMAAAARHKLNDSNNSPLGGNEEAPLLSESQFSGLSSMQNAESMSIMPPALVGYQGTQLFRTYPGKDYDEPNICGIVGGASYWFSYIPPESGVFYIDTIGSNFDTLLGVFVDDGSNKGYASLIQIACDNNSGNGTTTSALHVSVTKGATYFIMLDGKRGATGNVALHYLLNRKPTISSIANQTINEEQSAGPISFSIGDYETAPGTLQVSGTSSDQSLVPNTSIIFGGTGANRTVTVTPIPYHFGTTTITISVVDPSGNISTSSFQLGVLKINHAPIAVTDSYTRLTNHTIAISINAILRNDSDIDGDVITMTGVSSLSQLGYPVIKSGPWVTYYGSTPTIQDSFSYTISDGHGGTATGYVNIYVGANGQTVVY